MPLRGKKAVVEKSRPKVVFYGEAGVGKTFASLHFPKPYYIDTEEGIKYEQYVDILNKQEGVQFKSKDYKEIYKEVLALLTEKHNYKTVIIDSISKLYNNMATEAAVELAKKDPAKNPDGTAFGGHLKRAQNKLKPLFLLLERLDMNVILIAHSKTKWANGETSGTVFDFYDKLAYDLDLTLEITLFGKSVRKAKVIKSRITEFEMFESFDFSYDTFAKLYGKEYIERETKMEELATPEQLAELQKFFEMHHISQEAINKMLLKAKAPSLPEMERSKLQQCINALKKKTEELIAKKNGENGKGEETKKEIKP